MNFDLLDRYLLEEKPSKGEVVKALLSDPAGVPQAKPFYEGMRMLGPKTPDLTLIALRLILAGKKADDVHVVALRSSVERARARGVDRQSAIDAYFSALE